MTHTLPSILLVVERFLYASAKVMLVTVATAVLLGGSRYLGAAELKPFTSDGCSVFPNGTFRQNQLWLGCCRAHDYAYWKGGTYEERVAADKALQSCVESVGEESIALLMLAGVRVGGTPYLPTTFRWGYGWPYPRFYGPLSEEELRRVIQLSSSGGIEPQPVAKPNPVGKSSPPGVTGK